MSAFWGFRGTKTKLWLTFLFRVSGGLTRLMLSFPPRPRNPHYYYYRLSRRNRGRRSHGAGQENSMHNDNIAKLGLIILFVNELY